MFSAGAYANATLEVPNGYTADYAAAAGWKNFTNVSEYVLDVKVGDIFKVGGMTYAVTAVGESNNVKPPTARLKALQTVKNRGSQQGWICGRDHNPCVCDFPECGFQRD